MRYIKLTLQYDGTQYSGWQVQTREATVQGLLEKALSAISGERSRITGATRTDAGVHALEQVAVFKTGSLLDPDALIRAFNANLPDDIRVITAGEVTEDFHPRYDARNKIYSYIVCNNAPYPVFVKNYSWIIPFALRIDAMRNAATCITGIHDFSSFRASGCSSKNPIRTVMNIEIHHLHALDFMSFTFQASAIEIRIQANAFLRHMARNIVGTLIDIGRGKIPPGRMKEILNARDRKAAGRTAPACGLFLEKIVY